MNLVGALCHGHYTLLLRCSINIKPGIYEPAWNNILHLYKRQIINFFGSSGFGKTPCIYEKNTEKNCNYFLLNGGNHRIKAVSAKIHLASSEAAAFPMPSDAKQKSWTGLTMQTSSSFTHLRPTSNLPKYLLKEYSYIRISKLNIAKCFNKVRV